MDDDEASTVFIELLNILRERREAEELSGRDDYLSAIENVVDAGKEVKVKLSVREEKAGSDPLAGSRISTSSATAEFIQRQPFSGREKLQILLNGLELATVAPTRMFLTLNQALMGFGEADQFETANFGEDRTSSPSRTITVESFLSSWKSMGNLEELIKELKAALEEQPR